MSAMASPRASTVGLNSSASSARSSLSGDRPATNAAQPQTQRRNRAALRDYYGIKTSTPSNGASGESASEDQITPRPVSEEPTSELDKPEFDADAYIKNLLAKENLETVLRVETGLVSDIRGFDGERKALVYDNYSKLIAATDTIKSMRTNMDPLAPITSTLEPAVAHIADTARGLSDSLKERIETNQEDAEQLKKAARAQNDTQRQTVRWVLDTPRRLKALVQDGKQQDAQLDWQEIEQILDKWDGVKGVDEVREQSKAALAG